MIRYSRVRKHRRGKTVVRSHPRKKGKSKLGFIIVKRAPGMSLQQVENLLNNNPQVVAAAKNKKIQIEDAPVKGYYSVKVM